MRRNWQSLQLGGVARLINGRAYKKAELLDSGPYPVLRVGNFFTNRGWYYSNLELNGDKYCDNDDLLYAWSASFGPRIWEGGKVIYHYHIWKIECDGCLVEKRFLYYWLEWDKERIKKEQGAGTTMIHVTKRSMEQRGLELPPIKEQKRIVAILDEAFAGIDAAIANTEKNLANARELFENYLQSVFMSESLDWTRLGELCERVEYGSSAKSQKGGAVPVLRMGNIQDGSFSWDDLKYTDDPVEIEKYKLKYGDVLFNRTNSPELVGKSAIYKSERTAIFAGYLIRIKRKEGLLDADFLAYYLAYYLNSKIARNYGKSVMTSSVNQANINGTKLKQYPVPALALSEQKALVHVFHQLSDETCRLESIYEQKLLALSELKDSLLQKAVSGELTAHLVDTKIDEAVA